MQRLILGMEVENGLAALFIGHIHLNVAVKPAWTQQCGIQHFLTVRCGYQQNPRCIVIVDPVHLSQQLVQCLVILALLSAFALAADHINLIDKNNGTLLIFLNGTGTGIFK
ncbi:hypothetical protein D3C80_1853490 [compost metagenome]